MESATISAARAQLPANAIYADWAASALPLPVSTPACFIPPAHHANHPDLDKARHALQIFLHDTHDRYHVIFTSGATAALRILAERLPWSSQDALFCHAHVHNAVLGIRNPALSAGAQFRSLRSDELESELEIPAKNADNDSVAVARPGNRTSFALLTYPGECNLTGTSYPLSWARRAKERGLFSYRPCEVITLVDTAKLAASAPFCLDEHSNYVDAVVFSMYKLSACFTGLGALLVRKGSLLEHHLRSTAARSYFAGGRSVDAISPFSSSIFVPTNNLSHQLELGTPNLQAIHYLPSQLSYFSPSQKVMADIHRHATSIAASFSRQLIAAFSPVNVKIHSDNALRPDGKGSSVVTFTLYRTEWPSGVRSAIGHNEIATVLSVNNVYARAGCMCNTGACCAVLGFSDGDVAANYAQGHRCGDEKDLIHRKPTGVVRISFGWASLPQDADSIVQILRNHVCVSLRCHEIVPEVGRHVRERSQRFIIDSLYVYPVKSCAGAAVDELFCDANGSALGDRAFAIEDVASQELMNLRSCPELANVSARYSDFGSRLVLQVKSSNLRRDLSSQKSIDLEGVTRSETVSIHDLAWMDSTYQQEKCRHLNTGDVPSARSTIGGPEAAEWLSAVTGKRVRLVNLAVEEGRCGSVGDVLVVSKEEMQALETESGIGSLSILRAAIRPNIVLKRAQEGAEGSVAHTSAVEAFASFRTDTVNMLMRRGCTRCTVVNIVARAMGVDLHGEPLRAIAKLSRRNGQKGLVFGALVSFIGHGAGSNTSTSVVLGQEMLGEVKSVVWSPNGDLSDLSKDLVCEK